MPLSNGRIAFRDTRTGRWRRAAHYEKNRFFTIDTLSRGLANFTFKTMDGMAEIANDFADELVQYAVENAPWEDQTGDARAGLQAAVYIENGQIQIDLFHTVEYGIWLEVRWGGRYAIIIPTIEHMGPKLLDKMNNMISEIWYP